jgi:hypothetical protein
LQSEKVILALVDMYLLATSTHCQTPLYYAEGNGYSEAMISILATLMEKTDDD